ncbi:MAG TPA: DUF3592 domain-containing protein [Pyrinomonadaceae bacterium]|nr:DUF3592 domain-containing protein [Pyrinomonadaceae bacterium]
MENLIAGIFGLVLGLAGIWVGIKGLKNRALADRWHSTKGRVIERGIYQPDQPMLSAPAFRYAPLIRYRYEVGGKEFVSHWILPRHIQLPRHNTKKWAQKQADSFPDELLVRYNPAEPADSYLTNASRTALFVVLGASTVALLVGVLFLLKKFTAG